MAYDLYPAVDDDYNFPPEVRAALSTSPELRNTVIPMTTTQRNNLTGPQLWDGRLILNTTTDRINRYDLTNNKWIVIAEQSEAIISMTQAQRDALPGDQLWNGRIIFNLTTMELNGYNQTLFQWASLQGLPTTGGTITGDLTVGDSDSDRFFKRSLEIETHARSQTLTYADGLLTQVLEKSGSTTVKTTTMTYTNSRLTKVVVVAGGKTVTTNLVYTGETLTSVTRSVV